MNEISADELRAKKQEGYRPGDLVGRVGVERQLEGYLRGRTGFQKVVVDRRGVPKGNIRELVEGPVKQEPIPGNNVFLTLDMDLQRIAERALRNASAGAAVVVDVDTGRHAGAVSKPGFDPNEMSGHLSREAQARILADRFHPLRDKTLTETYFPGSTFKADHGAGGPGGQARSRPRSARSATDSSRSGDAGSSARRRTAWWACTTPSCRAATSTSTSSAPGQGCSIGWPASGRTWGWARQPGSASTPRTPGSCATEEWYREQKRLDPKNEGFQVGHALNAAIGQETRVTVLQMASMYAAIANGGKLWLPQVVERIESPSGRCWRSSPRAFAVSCRFPPENLAIVRQALVGVVNEPKGTAYKARPDEDLEVAGKTGTAQVRHLGRRGEPISGYEQNDHAWFAGFAPAGNPRVAFAMLIEHGGHGGEVAAPVAMEIMHGYFESVAPADRAAPHLGLPRRRTTHLVSASGVGQPPRRSRRPTESKLRLRRLPGRPP